MTAETAEPAADAAETAAEPQAAKRRMALKLPPKLVIAGTAAALLLAGVGGTAVWLWPKAADPAVAAASKEARKEARRAAAKASAAAAAAEAASASAPAADTAHEAEGVEVAQAAEAPHAEPRAEPHAAPDTAPAVADDPPAPHRAVHAAKARPAYDDEVPLDRLQRRLDEVLGGKSSIDASLPGELRLKTRSSDVVPVRHVGTVAAPHGTAEPAAGGSTAAHAAGHVTHWSYSGMTGPQAWGKLKAEFSRCVTGQRQSPIDIRDGIALDLDAVQFDYQPSSFSVIDNGHTVQVNVAPGNSIEVGGRRFALQQFHFHRPSEERINGRQFEMDAHLVHKDADGRLAVVAVLLERGAAQPLLQMVWNNLPLEKNEEVAARVQLDLNQLLPTDRRYYTYMGSLTTPPCSEGVLWVVMQQSVPVSAQQIDIFSRLYPMNARPIQRAAGRLIKQSN